MLYRQILTAAVKNETPDEITFYKIPFTKNIGRLIRKQVDFYEKALPSFNEVDFDFSRLIVKKGFNRLTITTTGMEILLVNNEYGKSFVEERIKEYNAQYTPKLLTKAQVIKLEHCPIPVFKQKLETAAKTILPALKKQIIEKSRNKKFETRFIEVEQYFPMKDYANGVSLAQVRKAFIEELLKTEQANKQLVHTYWKNRFYVSDMTAKSLNMVNELQKAK